VHGLAIESDFQIAEIGVALSEDEADSSCAARLNKVAIGDLPEPKKNEWVIRGAAGISVASGAYGTLVVSYCGSRAWLPTTAASDTANIRISRGRHISTTRFNHTILHAILPQILALRGEKILHSTCVIIDEKAILFAGDSGMGKSTLAAGFANRGFDVYSEDIVRLDRGEPNQFVAYPSYPGARLRGNSFLLPPEKRTNATGRFGLPKYRVYVDGVAAERPPMPVDAVFFLRAGRTVSPRVEPLAPMQAIKPLLKSSFLLALPKATRSREGFARTVQLAAGIPAFNLRYKRSAEHFERLLDSLIEIAHNLPVK
jgi:hypothetical protein